MRVICAPDSFKGALSALDAARVMGEAIQRINPEIEVVELPISDGGEGFAATMTSALHGTLHEVQIHHQQGAMHTATFGIAEVDGQSVGICDAASAIGLDLIPADERDIMTSTSYGLGELLAACVEAGAQRIVVGLGGSSTNDAGIGMMAALGCRFLDADGERIPPIPLGIKRLTSVDTRGVDAAIRRVPIEIACDVTNPLLGPDGASAVYGPQKGASPEHVEILDGLLARLVEVCDQATTDDDSVQSPDSERDSVYAESASVAGADLATDDPLPGQAAALADEPGAGAAGGLGWALRYFLGATLRPGFEVIADLCHLDDELAQSDLIVTAEGSIDRQTPFGKAISRLCEHAEAAGVPVGIFAGVADLEPDALPGEVRGIWAITPEGTPLDVALATTAENLERSLRENAELLSLTQQ